MTTVVLPPPRTAAAAAVSSPSISPTGCGSEELAALEEVESEPEEKENEPRSSNNANKSTIAKSAMMSGVTEPRYKKRPRVSFESADIVEFEPTLYTTTVTSGGIPVRGVVGEAGVIVIL